MIKLFDTHAHLPDEAFDEDRTALAETIREKNMTLVNCGCDEKSSYLSLVLSGRYPFMYAAVGMHPHDAKDYTDDTENKLKEWAKEDKCVAIGEIGLDYHYDYSPMEIQRKVFIRQTELADELNLPVIVHSRDAAEDTYDILKMHLKTEKGAVLHSFSQSSEMLKKYLDMNIMFSISGPVTFSNADKLRSMVEKIPINRLMIETDCPYLTPAPNRGKRNDPTNVEYVARKIAELKAIDYEELCKITYENAAKFFGIINKE